MNRSRNPYGWVLRMRPAALAVVIKSVLRVRRVRVVTAVGEFLVDPASLLGDVLITKGEYEPPLLPVLGRCLVEGSTFVDVGANEGYFSVAASALVGRSGRVFAIEPQRRLQDVVRVNLRLNGCANVQVTRVAITEADGETTLHLAPSINSGSSSSLATLRYPVRREVVASQSLESFFNEHGIDRCDLVKIDVEGLEDAVIAGATPLLVERRIRALLVEFHPQILGIRELSEAAIHEALLHNGYRAERLAESNTVLYEVGSSR